MNTKTQFENEKNESQTTNPIAKRLARMPHVIALPPQTAEPRELKHLIEARMAELNAEQLRLNMRDEVQSRICLKKAVRHLKLYSWSHQFFWRFAEYLA